MNSQARTYKIFHHLTFLVAIIFGAWDFAGASSLTNIRTFDKGFLDVGVGASYHFTDQNYSNTGSVFSLGGSRSYELIETPLRLRYGLFDRISISAGAMIATATSKNTDATRRASGATSGEFGVDWLFYQGFADVWFEAQVLTPFEKISSTQDTAINTEGVTEIKSTLGFSKEMSSFFLYGSGAINYRQGGRASLVQGQVGASYLFSNFMLGLETYGYVPMNDDADRGISETARYNLIQRVNAGSYHYYSVNPSYGAAKAWAEFPMLGMDWGVYASVPYYGQNIDAGPTFGMTLSMSFDLASDEQPHKSKSMGTSVNKNPAYGETYLSTQKKVNEFKERDDGVDQGIFNPQGAQQQKQTVNPDSEPGFDMSRVSRKKYKKAPTKKEIQNQLDDVEMTIKLKSNKK